MKNTKTKMRRLNKMNRASGTCKIISESITFMSLEFQKEKQKQIGEEKYFKKYYQKTSCNC